MSKWNGRRFLRKRTLRGGPDGFSGFSGLAFGPDNRLYSGVQLNDQTDQGPDTGPFARSVVSMTARGKDMKTVATGLRQPWQLTLVQRNPNPFVLFGGRGQGPEVVSMNAAGKQIKTFLSGYAAPVLAVGTRKGNVYTGDLTGAIYRVKAAG